MLTEGMFIADRYEILGKIGAGGMSDVYKAKDHVLGRFVAIKVLKQEFSEDVNFVTKFRTEAQSAGGLEHPNIVNIYDVGSEDGMHYIVMEYVEGITLKTYIEKKGQLSFKEAISIAIQVGRGIEAAHNKHIVHRDIKPQNIMISTEGKVKVTDFGIARAATSNTINSDVMGSVHYASPEQARNGFVDGKSDIYSLGIVMYEMVTGRVPFDGDTTVAVAIQHLQEEMVAPSAYAPDLPISLEKIILKCTQKNPDRRYQDMGELLLDLKKALISPNEDFVTMVPLSNQDKTRVIGDDELAQINEKTGRVQLKDTDYEEEDDEEEEEDEEAEDEDGILNPKMEKAVTIMGIAAAVIIIGIIIFIVGNLFGVFKFGSSKNPSTETETQTETETETSTTKSEGQKVTMVDVTNMTLDEAKAALEKIGLSVVQDGTTSSDTIEENKIVTQSVEKDTQVAKGTTVKVTLSSGAGTIAIPDVKNISSTEAQQKLTSQGFVVSTDYDYSDTVQQDYVISMNPEAGTAAKKGDTVTLILSRGTAPVQVPDVLNKPQADAQNELSAAGLSVSVASSEYNDTVAEGCVISQSIVGGKVVDRGTSISITVSLGKKSVYYTCSKTIEIPDDGNEYTKVDIVLTDDNGNTLNSQSSAVDDSTPSFSYRVTDIPDISSGTLKVTWSYVDEDGETQTTESSEKVTFTQQ